MTNRKEQTHRIIRKDGETYYAVDDTVISKSEYKKSFRKWAKTGLFEDGMIISVANGSAAIVPLVSIILLPILALTTGFGNVFATASIVSGMGLLLSFFLQMSLTFNIYDTSWFNLLSAKHHKKSIAQKNGCLMSGRKAARHNYYTDCDEVEGEEQRFFKAFFNSMSEDEIVEFWKNERKFYELPKLKTELYGAKHSASDRETTKAVEDKIREIDEELTKIEDYREELKNKFKKISERVKVDELLEHSDELLNNKNREYDPFEKKIEKVVA